MPATRTAVARARTRSRIASCAASGLRPFGAELIHGINSGTPLTPNGRQLARPMQLRQHGRVAPVGLHPVARLHRNERGRDDHAVMSEFGQLAMEAMAARPRLVGAAVRRSPASRQACGRDRAGSGSCPSAGPRPRVLLALQPPRSSPCGTSSPMNVLSCMRSLPRSRGSAPARLAQPSKENAAGEATDPVRSHRDHGSRADRPAA